MLMLGMCVHGIMAVREIKLQFKAFRDISVSVLQRRCYKLLGCSSVRQLNSMRCDPYKIQGLMRSLVAQFHARGGATSYTLNAGLVVNSYPTEKGAREVWRKRYLQCIQGD
jgi:hypothetical protein